MSPPLPAFGICGWSGSGKTTLIEALIPRLLARGLRAAVVKHDVHGIRLDPAGKDSDRVFKAGAAVALLGDQEIFCRMRPGGPSDLRQAVAALDATHDAVLCEGHKSASYERKVWLRSQPGEEPPADAVGIDRALDPGEGRVDIVDQMIQDWLEERLRRTPLYAGILIGGASRRMGHPKHLLSVDGMTWVERIAHSLSQRVEQIVLLGAGAIPGSLGAYPRLPDVQDKTGPLAGMLAAMRWRPDAAWLMVACDLPWLAADAVDWLISQRRPGVWALLPRPAEGTRVEPLLALYEPRIRSYLEAVDAPSQLEGLEAVSCPVVPAALAPAWRDADTPGDTVSLLPPARAT